jgi:hypothetical protein
VAISTFWAVHRDSSWLDQFGLERQIIDSASALSQSLTVPTESDIPAVASCPVNAIEMYCDPTWSVVDQPGRADAALAAPRPRSLIQRLKDQGGAHRRGGLPAQDPPGVGLDHELRPRPCWPT